MLANELRAAALDYAELGIPVFPFRPDGSKAYVKWGRDAEPGPSTDLAVICAWWRRWPLAMIAIPTGERSGLLVLDLDRKNGVDGVAELRRLGLVIDPDTPEVTTPSGGIHYYFSWSAADGLRNSAGKIAPGIDVRGEGGMVIAPPSRRTLDGLDYGWAEGSKPLPIGGPR